MIVLLTTVRIKLGVLRDEGIKHEVEGKALKWRLMMVFDSHAIVLEVSL
jgi:hypothetical protein